MSLQPSCLLHAWLATLVAVFFRIFESGLTIGTGQSRQEAGRVYCTSSCQPVVQVFLQATLRVGVGGGGQRSANQSLKLSSEDSSSNNKAERAERGEEARHLHAGQGQTETLQLKGNKCFSGIQVV